MNYDACVVALLTAYIQYHSWIITQGELTKTYVCTFYSTGTRGHYHESSDCFEYPKKTYLNEATQIKYFPNFPTQKNCGIETFKPEKIL